ncbi:MAG: hypothetical protein LCH31_00955 [Actinobacteria bacterium]|nr:hypothetical protein [Actinomycetota bacterium]
MRNRSKASHLYRLLVAAVATIAAAVSGVVVAQSPAVAAPVTVFQPGNIIDDALFYDGNVMNASEIQNFLNQRLATCLIGTPGYMPGDLSPSGSGNIIASNCLKDFRQTTSSQPADQYCAAYAGASNESSAQIIEKVGRACGISQKVLLVMLEKEQSLLTDSWPVTRQYNYALGMNCPDSGPNGSANCDAASAGFSKQLYLGARQLKVYKGNPNSFNYKPFQNNTIQWHPDRDRCGVSTFYIENWATAALYIYTPYRPNPAALNAGWGTGDSCSSYGNRNFFLFYTSWFGSTHVDVPTHPVTGKIRDYWDLNKSWLGQPQSPAVTGAMSGGGRLQSFQGGYVYESNAGDAVGFVAGSPILTAFSAAGGLEGPWGWPLKPALSYGSGNAVVRFQGGAVVETRAVGVFLVPEAVRPAWEQVGGYGGQLGYPTGSAVSVGSLGGTVQNFRAGELYSSPSGVFPMLVGPVRDGYAAAGGPAGAWGWPVGKAICNAGNTQCSGVFENGIAVITSVRGSLFTSFTAPTPAVPEVVPGSGESVTGGTVL